MTLTFRIAHRLAPSKFLHFPITNPRLIVNYSASLSTMAHTIAAIQMTSTGDKRTNQVKATQLIREAVSAQAKMIFLPECFDYVAENKVEASRLSEPLDGPIITHYCQLAKECGVWLSLGGFHEKLKQEVTREGSNKGENWIANKHLVINSQGMIVGDYQKIHLFDYQKPGSSEQYFESSYVSPGSSLQTVSTPFGVVGLGVCYDLRFPEFSQRLREKGSHLLTFPSAFTVKTGKAHWECLLRARAIETQCYVVAAAQVGSHNAKRASYGHTMIINPWGKVLGELENEEGIVVAQINLSELEETRASMPVQSHRRPDIYSTEYGEILVPNEEVEDPTIRYPFSHIQFDPRMVFAETRFTRAVVNRKCLLPGHVLIITKNVIKRVSDLSPAERADFFTLAAQVQKLMEFVHDASSSTITIQDGSEAGQTIEHLHMHIIPRKSGDYVDNDHIYKDLANHDKGEVEWRKDEEMIEEALQLRESLRKILHVVPN